MMRELWRGMALTAAMGVSGIAYAHEFVAKPATMTVQAGVIGDTLEIVPMTPVSEKCDLADTRRITR